jgi:phosphopantetheine--protein transferase-like protein
MGPNYIVDGACASALLAIELSIKELQSGRCDMVITGGVHATTPPQIYMMFCLINALSRSNLRSFDKAADGTLLGEGLGCIVIKRLEDAERDGDRIYAVLKGVGSSSDGKALGLLAPRYEGQLLALQRAYSESDIDPESIGLIEAHGTGMPVGDRTEVQSLGEVFGQRGGMVPSRAIGSVKSMIGHCIPSAGIAGLIKAVLALHHKVLPPTLCDEVNPELGMEETSLYVNNETRPWIHGSQGTPRRAGVNAFGFGGINSHAIVEEYTGPGAAQHAMLRWPSELCVFAAADQDGLRAIVRKVRARLAADTALELAQLAATLSGGEQGPYRLAVVCQDLADLDKKLGLFIDAREQGKPLRGLRRRGLYFGAPDEGSEVGKIAFLFPGEGGQFQNMLADLCLYFPEVREWFDVFDEALCGLAEICPSALIFAPPTCLGDDERKHLEQQLFTLDMGSAAVFVASMAIFELLTRIGVKADAMVGHSTGEGTALVASGIVRLGGREELVEGMRRFNRTYRELADSGRIPTGALLTVGAVDGALIDELVAGFEGRLYVALENCPNQTVLFGERADVDKATERLKEAGAICMPMPFDRAYHTPLFANVEPTLRTLYVDLDFTPGHTPVYSCATTEEFPREPDAMRDLATRQWFTQVRFRQTVDKLYEQGFRTFVEVGPGGNLSSFVRDTLARREHMAASTNVQGKPGLAQLQQLLAQLFAAGATLDFTPLYARRQLDPIDLDAAPVAAKAPYRLQHNLAQPYLDAATVSEIRSRLRPAAPAQVNTAAAAPRAASEPEPVKSEAAQDPRTAALRSHFELMQEFLASQGRVLTQLAGEAAPSVGVDAAVPQAVPATPDRGQMSWPLVGEIVERDSSRLYAVRRFDINRDHFLRDHTFGSPLSARQPELRPLPIVPLTVSMEMAAEAASLLSGGRSVVGLDDVRGYRWLALDKGELQIGVAAQFGGDGGADDVTVRLFELGSRDGKQTRQLVFEAIVKLADGFPTAPAPMPFDLTAEAASHYSPQTLYQPDPAGGLRYVPMFHGPMFQGVKQIRRWGREGMEADMSIVSRAGFFGEGMAPRFQVDPVLIDSAGQLVGYWIAEQFGPDLSFFPFRVRAYRQYAPPLDEGAAVLCRAAIRLVDAGQPPQTPGFDFLDRDGGVVASIKQGDEALAVQPAEYYQCRLQPKSAHIEAVFDFLDANGRVVARLEGWQDRYFSLPHDYYRCRQETETAFYSVPWLQAETQRVIRRIDPPATPFLDESWGIWKRVLAHLMLSANERRLWYTLSEEGPRRSDWLMGRIAAKDAVRQWALDRFAVQLAPVDVEIVPDASGKPVVHCPALADLTLPPEVSISHSRGYTVAAVSEPASQVGIDLERLEQLRSYEFLEGAFSDDERALIEGVPEGARLSSVAGLWCAKEAAAKAHGTGLKGDPRKWSVSAISARDGRASVRHEDSEYQVWLYASGEEVMAFCEKPPIA